MQRRGAGAVIFLLALVAVMLLVRLATLGSYPLMDTSEARYGEIARVMLTTGNFVTPQEVPGVPFWAKPPLYAWLSCASMLLLGVSEFALRLPSWLCAIGVLALSYSWSASMAQSRQAGAGSLDAPLTLALLASSVLFFVSAGAVMTDPSLALCSTGMLAAFHHVVIAGKNSPIWRWGFFAAAGLAMLAKGPVILLYAGLPILLWALWTGRIVHAWRALPWLSGTVLAALLCVPWYVLAEQRTPGFLQYFLLGEHVMRFLQPGWGGDMYGTAHAEPLGTIWLHLAGALGASTVLLLAAALLGARALIAAQGRITGLAPERRFLLLAALVPIVFFTFAGNIIWTYVLPALAPLSVLLASLLGPRIEQSRGWRYFTLATLALAGASVCAAIFVWVPRHVARHSSAELAEAWRGQERLAPGDLFFLGRKAPASLRFYTRVAVHTVTDPEAALQDIDQDRYLALAPARVPEVIAIAAARAKNLSVEEIGHNEDLALLHLHAAAVTPPAGAPR